MSGPPASQTVARQKEDGLRNQSTPSFFLPTIFGNQTHTYAHSHGASRHHLFHLPRSPRLVQPRDFNFILEMDFASSSQSKVTNLSTTICAAESSSEGSVIIKMKTLPNASNNMSSSSSFGPSSSQQSLASTPRPTTTITATKGKTINNSSTTTTATINTNAAGFMSFLINGELVLIQKDSVRTSKIELELFDDGKQASSSSLLHVVCVSEGAADVITSSSSSSSSSLACPTVCQLSVWETAAVVGTVFRHRHVAALAVGEAVDLVMSSPSSEPRQQQQRRMVTLEISTRPPGSMKNRSETKFLEHALGELLSAQDGAPSMSKLLNPAPSLGQWIPPHAEQLLFANPHINTFLNQSGGGVAGDGGVCCVARKKAKPKYHRRCPVVQAPLGIRGILRRAALSEAAWKQCGATFSTMMRHFQKAPDVFEWKTDDEKRTVIRHQKQKQQQ